MDYLIVTTTTATQEEAVKIAESLVQRRLAGCVQIVGPIQSVYRWKGKVTSDTEYRCEIKTRKDKMPAVRQLVAQQHSYELPEIIAVPLADMSVDYQRWLDEQLQDES